VWLQHITGDRPGWSYLSSCWMSVRIWGIGCLCITCGSVVVCICFQKRGVTLPRRSGWLIAVVRTGMALAGVPLLGCRFGSQCDSQAAWRGC
jgi:hypothetical protein